MAKKPEAITGSADKVQEENREVGMEDLKNNFYITQAAILQNLNAKENIEKIFEKNSLNKSGYLWVMAIAALALITFVPLYEYHEIEMIIMAFAFTGVGFLMFIAFTVVRIDTTIDVNGRPTNSVIASMLMGLIFGVCFGAPLFIFFVLPSLLTDQIYMIAYMSGIVCITIMFFCIKHMKKRTKYGNELLGKIKGFRNFLETTEKPRLEKLVIQNPEYFYKILPYTYVLGVSDKWIKKFENIALSAPKWYSGRRSFQLAAFGSFMSSAMIAASQAMSASPSSSSSGGGSSGGGSGGGGGRSW